MIKRILSVFLGLLILLSVSVFASGGAIYEVETSVEVLEHVSTNSKDNWKTEGGRVALTVEDGAIRAISASDDEFSVDMLAGGDLFEKTKPAQFRYWNFENASDGFFAITSDREYLQSPSLLPVDRWASFFTSCAYWTSPSFTNIDNVQYKNTVTGSEYTGVKTPSAPGSTGCIAVGLGGNDWHYDSLGIKVKLPAEKVIPGKTYVLTYYTMDNSAVRDLYAAFTKPSQSEPSPNGGMDDWYLSNPNPVDKINRCWTKGSVEIVADAEAYEDGYTMLWLGTRGATLERNERIYFDSINLVAKDELVQKEVVFTAKVKGNGNNQPVTVSTVMADNVLSSETVTAANDWETIELRFYIDLSDDFYLSEERGSNSAIGKFKVQFSSSGKDRFYIKDVSLHCPMTPNYFSDIIAVVGSGMNVTAKVFAPKRAECFAVLALYSEQGEQVLERQEVLLSEGENEIGLSGVIPTGGNSESVLVLYLEDSDGNIISERRQCIADLFINGINIAGDGIDLKEALELFGAGEYLIEFATQDSVIQDAVVSIGGLSTTAVINDNIGSCELELSESDIAAMRSSVSVSVSGTDAQAITMKKILDI